MHYLIKHALYISRTEIWTLDFYRVDFGFLFLSIHKSENTVNSQKKKMHYGFRN